MQPDGPSLWCSCPPGKLGSRLSSCLSPPAFLPTAASGKKQAAKSKEEMAQEKKKELEKRLQDVSGQLSNNKKPAKKGEWGPTPPPSSLPQRQGRQGSVPQAPPQEGQCWALWSRAFQPAPTRGRRAPGSSNLPLEVFFINQGLIYIFRLPFHPSCYQNRACHGQPC